MNSSDFFLNAKSAETHFDNQLGTFWASTHFRYSSDNVASIAKRGSTMHSTDQSEPFSSTMGFCFAAVFCIQHTGHMAFIHSFSNILLFISSFLYTVGY